MCIYEQAYFEVLSCLSYLSYVNLLFCYKYNIIIVEIISYKLWDTN